MNEKVLGEVREAGPFVARASFLSFFLLLFSLLGPKALRFCGKGVRSFYDILFLSSWGKNSKRKAYSIDLTYLFYIVKYMPVFKTNDV
ncbi:hypothetical protein F5X96DRAFT_612773 [Biscogniauxia mediterranea]|nr:hypothetical protein F5X96DRAFT_612773 [Biscogniauxia mediterranea]